MGIACDIKLLGDGHLPLTRVGRIGSRFLALLQPVLTGSISAHIYTD